MSTRQRPSLPEQLSATALAELTGAGLAVLDAHGRVTSITAPARRLLGVPEGDLPLLKLVRAIAPEPADREALVAALVGTRLDARPRHVSVERPGVPLAVAVGTHGTAIVLLLVPAQGSQAIAAPAEGRAEGARWRRRIARLDRLATTGQLAAGIAHEVNNPLQAILVHLQLVADQLPPDFAERESFERVVEGLQRVREVARDLLDLHRGGEHATGPVDLNTVLGEALALVRTPLKRRGLNVVRDLAPDLPPARGLARHVYQVALNLLLNAMDALGRGGTVVVRTRAGAPGQLEFEVADDGPGIPEHVMAHVFAPFQAGSGQGTGLGLFVTWGLVRQLGGTIQVDSTPGRGSTFRVSLPADTAADEGRLGAAPNAAAPVPPLPGH